jgi:hypothetical protein
MNGRHRPFWIVEAVDVDEISCGGQDQPADVGGQIGFGPNISEIHRFHDTGSPIIATEVSSSRSNPSAASRITLSLAMPRWKPLRVLLHPLKPRLSPSCTSPREEELAQERRGSAGRCVCLRMYAAKAILGGASRDIPPDATLQRSNSSRRRHKRTRGRVGIHNASPIVENRGDSAVRTSRVAQWRPHHPPLVPATRHSSWF